MTGIDPGWLTTVTPVLVGAGVGLVARRVIAVADKRKAELPRPGARR